MAVLLDTSVAISLRDGDEAILERIQDLPSMPMISVITRVELEGGVHRFPRLAPLLRPRLDLLLAQVTQLPFEEEQATAYGRIVEMTGYSRARVIDRMIAAQAIVASARLATTNVRDFRDIPGLLVEDWSRGPVGSN